MLEIQHKNYFPLLREEIDSHVPSKPGVFVLAVRLANGVNKPVYSTQSDNLYRSLLKMLRRMPADCPSYVLEVMKNYQCYFTIVQTESAQYRNQLHTTFNEFLFPGMA